MTGAAPSHEYPDGFAALKSLMVGAESVSAAVAFVTSSGVSLLESIVEEHPDVEFDVTARGAPITQRDALLALRDELNCGVSLVVGEDASKFHPKLWLVRHPERLVVLSGSGNLTAGGLRTNREQFEVLELAVPSAEASDHEARFRTLVAGAVPLSQVEKSVLWRDWKFQEKRRADLAKQLHALDQELAKAHVANRDDDKALLLADLLALVESTKAAGLKRADGVTYYPSRFKQALNAASRGERDPVIIVTNICRQTSFGYDILANEGLKELTVERLVVDETKPYFSLFDETTLALARDRLAAFD